MAPDMGPCARPRVKICCIQDLVEAEQALLAGADALGLVSEMPSGPGAIPDERIGEIARALPRGVDSFLLTCRQRPAAIARQARAAGVTTVQLCDALEGDAYAELRAELPGVALVQVIHVVGRAAVEQALRVAPLLDALLLDSGDPRLAVKQLGGTGRRHDWTLSREVRERAPVPLYLAGGLTPANAGEAIGDVAPFGLDVCSGVRTDGRLDPGKLAAFMAAARP
jgi:phosphoribosylanthranilate isomerase